MNSQKIDENKIKKDKDYSDIISKAREAIMNGGLRISSDVEPVNIDNKGNDKYKTPTPTTDEDGAVADFIKSFGATGSTPYKAYDWVINIPSDTVRKLSEATSPVILHGTICVDTESAYVFPSDAIGQVIGLLRFSDEDRLPGRRTDSIRAHVAIDKDEDGTLRPFVFLPSGETHPARIKEYDTTVNLFSRNSGLLESDVMLDKTAVLIGCGSVGSFVAMELARSGVGRFVLVDTDTLEVHNICRHQCGFDDLGRYKVEAVRDKILNINPLAEVKTFRLPIERVPEDEIMPYLGRNTVIVGGGDNRASADTGCKLACKTDSSFVATCCWNRAFAGEVFYWQSGHGLSCYECALGGLIDSDRPDAHSHYFGDDEDATKTSFEPGVAVDIDFVTVIATKLILDLLNRDNPGYTPRLINYLRQYTWVCNTNEEAIGGERALMFSNPLQVTTSLSVCQREGCEWCDAESHGTVATGEEDGQGDA